MTETQYCSSAHLTCSIFQSQLFLYCSANVPRWVVLQHVHSEHQNKLVYVLLCLHGRPRRKDTTPGSRFSVSLALARSPRGSRTGLVQSEKLGAEWYIKRSNDFIGCGLSRSSLPRSSSPTSHPIPNPNYANIKREYQALHHTRKFSASKVGQSHVADKLSIQQLACQMAYMSPKCAATLTTPLRKYSVSFVVQDLRPHEVCIAK